MSEMDKAMRDVLGMARASLQGDNQAIAGVIDQMDPTELRLVLHVAVTHLGVAIERGCAVAGQCIDTFFDLMLNRYEDLDE